MEDNVIIIKKSTVLGNIPNINALENGELAINCADGYIFFKKNNGGEDYLAKFVDLEGQPYVLDTSLSAIKPQYGGNTVNEVFATVLGGYNNDVEGAASTVINGENNDIFSDFSLIGNGLNNKILSAGDYSFIGGGENNLISHRNVFTFGSNLSSHDENFTYVNNISATGKLYGDGSELIGIAPELKYIEISNNQNLQVNKNYILIANNSSYTVTLPSSPLVGDCISFITDISNSNYIIIDRNGNKINEIEDNLQCDIDAFFTLIYRDSQIGWKLYFK